MSFVGVGYDKIHLFKWKKYANQQTSFPNVWKHVSYTKRPLANPSKNYLPDHENRRKAKSYDQTMFV